jgi:hypothetical protein
MPAPVIASEQARCCPDCGVLFAARAFTLPTDTPPVARLRIDEIRRGKARLPLLPGEGGDTWEVVAGRWHVGLTDLGGGAGLLGHGRYGVTHDRIH